MSNATLTSGSEQYVNVYVDDDDSLTELPLEDDGSLLLTTLKSLNSNATGLISAQSSGKPSKPCYDIDGRIHPPEGSSGVWKGNFKCVFDKKPQTASPNKEKNRRPTCDLVVLGLPFSTSEDRLRKYFSRFGELQSAQIKRQPQTGESRGFAFIRFASIEAQEKVIGEDHKIDGRKCSVRIPDSKPVSEVQETDRKIHVKGITPELTSDVLQKFFGEYGQIEDIFVPSPLRNFVFITFKDPNAATELIGKELKIRGVPVQISSAAPKLYTRQAALKNAENGNSDPMIDETIAALYTAALSLANHNPALYNVNQSYALHPNSSLMSMPPSSYVDLHSHLTQNNCSVPPYGETSNARQREIESEANLESYFCGAGPIGNKHSIYEPPPPVRPPPVAAPSSYMGYQSMYCNPAPPDTYNDNLYHKDPYLEQQVIIRTMERPPEMESYYSSLQESDFSYPTLKTYPSSSQQSSHRYSPPPRRSRERKMLYRQRSRSRERDRPRHYTDYDRRLPRR